MSIFYQKHNMYNDLTQAVALIIVFILVKLFRRDASPDKAG